MTMKRLLVLLFAMLLLPCACAERIKDLAGIQGIRNNQLSGYGIVVGLDGTGDQTTQTPFTVQSIASMLSQMGVNLPPGQQLQLKNVAAVMVTAVLPPFAQPGQEIDVTVSSIGNAKSLRGGTLLLTPLKGADNRVYAMAQGNLLVGGAGASSAGSSKQINHLLAGRISNQDLKSEGPCELLMIVHPDFMEQAKRLAAHRSENSRRRRRPPARGRPHPAAPHGDQAVYRRRRHRHHGVYRPHAAGHTHHGQPVGRGRAAV